ncbi:hypothetical protein [Streptomyces sp. NBC_00829]|uniref:hypothetical protein n=1 Tax=Streptomyces sp. NBC_00829 TaxID=2903679 RepID=UPI00386E5783|nr:hypothetical protein OG293_23045 [Streptomyces sp. NBC_00829]
MTGMSGIRFCCLCDRPILGKAERVEQFSASGARPDSLRHPAGDPDCRRTSRT